MLIDVKLSQPERVLFPIDLTDEGMLIDFKPMQL